MSYRNQRHADYVPLHGRLRRSLPPSLQLCPRLVRPRYPDQAVLLRELARLGTRESDQ